MALVNVRDFIFLETRVNKPARVIDAPYIYIYGARLGHAPWEKDD